MVVGGALLWVIGVVSSLPAIGCGLSVGCDAPKGHSYAYRMSDDVDFDSTAGTTGGWVAVVLVSLDN